MVRSRGGLEIFKFDGASNGMAGRGLNTHSTGFAESNEGGKGGGEGGEGEGCAVQNQRNRFVIDSRKIDKLV